jgi:hypothetical protein
VMRGSKVADMASCTALACVALRPTNAFMLLDPGGIAGYWAAFPKRRQNNGVTTPHLIRPQK